jgi:hypothetical protein
MYDGVAASVTVPASFEAAMLDAGVIEEPLPKKIRGQDVPPFVSPDALSDLASDMELEDVLQLCSCEAICDAIHIVRGNP